MKRTTSLILIVIAIGLFYTVTSPQYKEVQALRTSASEYKNVIDNVENIAESRDRLLVEYEAIPQTEIEKLNKAVPNNVDAVRIALDLGTIASRYGVAIQDVQVDTKSSQESSRVALPNNDIPYEKIAVSFSFVSDYESFMRILADLEKSLRIMDVKSIVFQVSDQGLYEHMLMVETYSLK